MRFVCLLLFCANCMAVTESDVSGSADLPSDIRTWVTTLEDKPNDYYECRRIAEVRNTTLCLATTQKHLDTLFARASMYIEGSGLAKGTIAALDSYEYYIAAKIAGYDLRAVDIRTFNNALKNQCVADVAFCALQAEEEFLNWASDLQPDMVIISASIDLYPLDVIRHEIRHAQYFQQSNYRDAVDGFWATKVDADTKELIKSELSTSYDVTDEVLVRNEFQAYIQDRGVKLSRFAALHDPLIAALNAAGAPPIPFSLE